MGLYQFGLVQYTSSARNVLKDRVDQHQVITVGGTDTSLAAASTLTAQDGVSFLATLAKAQGAHAWLRVVLDIFLGQDQPTAQNIHAINKDILE